MVIDFYPCQSHCFAFGGFEVQCLDLMAALSAAGVECRRHDPWSRVLPASHLHFFGVHHAEISWAKKSGKRLIATTLFSHYDTVYSKARNLGGRWFGHTREIRKNIAMLDALVVVNEIQRQVAVKYFGMDPSRIYIVSNIIPDIFFPTQLEKPKGNKILCIGGICQRKNQLRVIEAAAGLECELVMIGKAMEGEDNYYEAVKKAAQKAGNVTLVPWLDRIGGEYISLLSKSRLLILPSHHEVQPIVALEMGALGKQVILGRGPYAYQKIYDGCGLCDPLSVKNIKAVLARGLEDETLYLLNPENLTDCRASKIAEAQIKCYKAFL